jgi:hypothetical protein
MTNKPSNPTPTLALPLKGRELKHKALSLKRLCHNGEFEMIVILNEVKNLIISTESIIEILRLMPQNDITTQSRRGGNSLCSSPFKGEGRRGRGICPSSIKLTLR